VIPVKSADDPAIALYRNLTDVSLRRRLEPDHGIFMAESQSVIARALEAGYQPRSALTIERGRSQIEVGLGNYEVNVYVGSEDVLKDITGYRVHRGALAVMERRALPSAQDVVKGARRVVVLEGIVDHTNVGAAFRSAAGLGFDAVLIDSTCADPLYRRSVRVSMGAVFALPWTRLESWPEDLQMLRDAGFVIASLTPASDASDISQWAHPAPSKVALLVGTEGDGLTAHSLAAADVSLRIPMTHEVDSLNVAAAVAVACYALRSRDHEGS
jgi:tRNA G18 (ribose-2'-O)-methylase SpoU